MQKGIRKYIRKQKSLIKREGLSLKEINDKIKELMSRVTVNKKNK